MTPVHRLLIAIVLACALASPALAEEVRCPGWPGASVQRSPTTLEGAASYVYKTVAGGDLRLHLLRAPDAKPPAHGQPVLVMIYGGGWMGGAVDMLMPTASHIVGQGGVLILVDYRTYCRNGANVGDEVADAKDAIRWIRRHARELGVDPHRIAVSGGSSGGHLAASAAVFADADADGISSRPDLLLLWYPCVDLTNEYEKGSAKALAQYGRDLSPLYHVRRGLPPIYLFEGSLDPLVTENRRFCDEVRAKGDRCQWTLYEGAKHGFFYAQADPPSPWYQVALKAMDDTLIREGYLPGRPPGLG